MKGSIMMDFMLFVVALIILTVILSTAFGKGVVFNVIETFGSSNSNYLSEEFSLLLSAVAYAPGDMTATLNMEVPHTVKLAGDANGYDVTVKDKSKTFLANGNTIDTTPITAKGGFEIKKVGTALKIEASIT